jgi:hypothetical protein
MNSDSAIFCFGEENMNSYEENKKCKDAQKYNFAPSLRSVQRRRKDICANKGLRRP